MTSSGKGWINLRMTFGFYLSNCFIENNIVLSYVPEDFHLSKISDLY